MLEFFGIDNQSLIVFLAAVLAAGSFMAFASMFLSQEEKKERFKDIVQKRRKALYDAAREGQDRNIISSKDPAAPTAAESMAMLYKMQNMLGDMGEQIRDQMLQAGYRNPQAPINYMIARIVVPIVFVLLALLILNRMEEPYSAAVQTLIYLGAAGFGFYLPQIMVQNQKMKRQEEIDLSFPDALDMMLICVQGGIGLEQAVDRIAEEIVEQAPVLAEELGILSAELSMLNDRKTALGDFARRVGSPAAKSFTTALIQAEQYGTSVSQAMRVLSEDMRDIRMQRAEEKAMALPPKLTVPMILFFLPSLFIVILGPVGIQIGNM